MSVFSSSESQGWTLAAALFAGAVTLVLTGCETAPDPKEGPTADVSSMPWNRQESWEGNPYGSTFQGTR